MENFRTRLVDEWGARGFSFFNERIFSSSLQRLDLPKVRDFLSVNNFKNVDISLVIPPNNDTSRMSWFRYYKKSGHCVSEGRNIYIPALSNNLKMTFCYFYAETRNKSRNDAEIVATSLRLIFGVPIARELLLVSNFSKDDAGGETLSDEGYASPFDTQSLNMFENPAIQGCELNRIPEEAATLLDAAFAQPYPKERFVLMWLAFEAITRHHPSGGENGKARERICKSELGSEIVNAEVFRLFRLRCEILKEGSFSNRGIDEDCWSLYAVIQLFIIKDCPQRSAFLLGYESKFNNNSTKC